MCTSAVYKNYFGRNLDFDISYGERVVIQPRDFAIKMRMEEDIEKHYAMIGMASVIDGQPLFYDAVNEKGVGIAGLLFAGNATYYEPVEGKKNVTPFEFIPWLLGHAGSAEEIKELLKDCNLVNVPFSEELPLTPMHWMISDKEQSITVETLESGMKVYDNPVGVLTNNPPFDMQMFALRDYMSLHTNQVENTAFPGLDLEPYSRGFGGLGLPGDLSSKSRFIKATFTKMNSLSEKEGDLSQFFHILDSVCQQRGLVHMGDGKYEINPDVCIECGACADTCPVGAPAQA